MFKKANIFLSRLVFGGKRMGDFGYVKSNLSDLLKEIETLGGGAGNNVTLVAVTKGGSDDELLALCEAGITNIGENRPAELKRRGELIQVAGHNPALHQIGNLQRNKVKLIIEKVALIHSLDNLPLALEIDKQAGRVGRVVPVLIEINSAREEQKDGILPENAEAFLLELRKLRNISVQGLMTMGPVCENSEEIRPYFKATKELFDRLNEDHGFDGGILSMGMSDSYAVAIEEGATMVRVGRKLFER